MPRCQFIKMCLCTLVCAVYMLAYQSECVLISSMQGHPRLVKALASLYSPLYGRQIDPMTEVSRQGYF